MTEQATRGPSPGAGDQAPAGIELEDVTLRFPAPDGSTLTVFDSFSLEVQPGSFTVIVGPSGCGKSTLLNVIDGILPPTEAGAVRVLGTDIRENRDVTRNMAYVFQSPRLLRWKTLRGNVEFGMKGLRVKPRDQWPSLIDSYFDVVGLSEYADYYPHQVSGGMQQRAAIVRAWVNEPAILLMDEPFSHLDEITGGELRSELTRLWMRDEPRRTVVFITHDLKEAVALGTHVVMLRSAPAEVVHTQEIDLPFPRRDVDQEVFETERQLRLVFAERARI